MAKHDVNIVIKARDEATRVFGIVGTSAISMGSMIRKAAAYVAVYLSARAIKRFTEESLAAYGEQEAALKKLTDALSLLGPVSAKAMKDYEAFADQIQKSTVIGDEEVLSLMAQGAAMGKMSGKELKDATKAAIGLSKAYGVELVAAMRLVSRARVGDTSTLTKYGIKLEEGLNKHEKFNRVLEIGARNFRLAEGEAETYTGRVAQMKNAFGEVKEAIGEALMPTFKEAAVRIRDWCYENKQRIGEWAKATIAWVEDIKDAFLEFVRFMREDWKSGLRFALDVFLQLLEASFKTAVTMAVAGGRGIWKGVKEGLLGGEAGQSEIDRQTRLSYQKGGGVFKQVPTAMGAAGAMGYAVPTYKLEPADAELYKQLREIVAGEYAKRETESIIGGSIKAIKEYWRDMRDDIVEGMPEKLGKNLMDALRDNAEKRFGREMEAGAGITAAGVPAAPETVKELVQGKRQGLTPMEGQYLTFAPGRTFETNYQQQAVKAALEQVKRLEKADALLTKIADGISQLVRKAGSKTIPETAFP